MRPAAVLFDIDGTLMDDDRAVLFALTAFHSGYSSELDLSITDLLTRWKGLLNLYFARYLAGEMSIKEQRRARIRDLFANTRLHLSDGDADCIFASYEREYRAAWQAYPDSLPMLDALRHLPLGVLSNGDREQQTGKLQKCGLAPYFFGIFVSSEIGFAKPSPEAFLTACRRMDTSPGQCIYVGDNLLTDARASASAGLIGIWLNRSGVRAESGVDVPVIRTLADLPALVEGQRD
jgi:putative hydrolase of the HAD superfamily